MTHYFGIDGSYNYYPNKNERPSTLVLCYSTDNVDVTHYRIFPRDKAFNGEFLNSPFLYISTWNNLTCCEIFIRLVSLLIQESIRKFCNFNAPIEAYIDGFFGQYPLRVAREIEKNCSSNRDFLIINGDDTKHSLVHRADNLASIISFYFSKKDDAIYKTRQEKFRRLYPHLDERLEECKVTM